MTNDENFAPDLLRPVQFIQAVDPRSDNQPLLDALSPGAVALIEHHACIDAIKITAPVPEVLFTQFETVKNLYLYAWHVYRFFAVAEHQALVCLEFGLKQHFPNLPTKNPKQKGSGGLTLAPLLQHAIETGAIRNQGFRQYRDQTRRRAHERYSIEQHAKMVEQNLEQIELDYDSVQPNGQDRDWDFLSILLRTLPKTRNEYAHGSTLLRKQVLGTIEVVAEVLNQLYESSEASKDPLLGH